MNCKSLVISLDWHRSSLLIYGLRTVRHRITKEIALIGRWGEIWIIGDGSYCTVITSNKIANQLAAELGRSNYKYKKHEEAVLPEGWRQHG